MPSPDGREPIVNKIEKVLSSRISRRGMLKSAIIGGTVLALSETTAGTAHAQSSSEAGTKFAFPIAGALFGVGMVNILGRRGEWGGTGDRLAVNCIGGATGFFIGLIGGIYFTSR